MKKILAIAVLGSVLVLGACQSTTSSHQSAAKAKGLDSALMIAAQKASDQGAQKESLLFYEELYRRNPKNIEAVITYTRALRHDGQVKKAEIILEAWKGKSVGTDLEYARTLLALGRFYETQTLVESVLEKDPENAQANHVLALVLDNDGQHAAAEEYYRKALAVWEGSPVPVLNNLSLNLAMQDKKGEAIALIDKAMIYAPHDAYLKKNRELLMALKGQIAVSKEQVETPKKDPAG